MVTLVSVRIAETYDLHTVKNTTSLLGIHTPATSSIRRQWGGFLDNYKWMRIKGCNVTCACASYLPADPLQVGTTSGQVAPQDMFNPILYKAVSNASFETLVSSVYDANSDFKANNSINEMAVNPGTGSGFDQWDLYYGILGQPGWKKAMPQAGFSMRGLRPLIHSLVSTFGNVNVPQPNAGNMNNLYVADSTGNPIAASQLGRVMRGKPFPMGKLPTKASGATGQSSTASKDFEIPITWVGVCVLPPYALNALYYRLRVVWEIEFFSPRSTISVSNYLDQAYFGTQTYYSDYSVTSSKMDETTNSVDTIGAEIQKVMDS